MEVADIVAQGIDTVNQHLDKFPVIDFLREAILQGNLEITKFLVEDKGFDPYSNDCAMLFAAAASGQLEIIKYFDGGREMFKEWADEVFIEAACHGQLSIIRYLLEDSGAGLGREVTHGIGVFLAFGNGKADVIRYLVKEHDLDLKSLPFPLLKAFQEASNRGHFELIKLVTEELEIHPADLPS